jgi:starvation-inducible DNA-binding protein
MALLPSPSPIPETEREKLVDVLASAVLELLALSLVARKAHWNVRSADFRDLHKFFGKVYEESDERADTIAEHVAMLGGMVPGDHVDVGEEAKTEPLPSTNDGEMLRAAVLDRIRAVLKTIADAGTEAARRGDADGQQLLIDASLALSKVGWMLAASADG